jgi:DNA helicase-2/ATP-dependent DNA helicase PcrA
MAGMEDGIFPHSRALFDGEQMEEERRLCYVGMTRAKERLFLTYANTRMLYGQTNTNPPSRFVLEIPPELQSDSSEWSSAYRSMASAGHCKGGGSWSPQPMYDPTYNPWDLPKSEDEAAARREEALGLNLEPGDKIAHAKFGEGVVGEVNGDEITATFAGVGTKKLSLSFAPIKKV